MRRLIIVRLVGLVLLLSIAVYSLMETIPHEVTTLAIIPDQSGASGYEYYITGNRNDVITTTQAQPSFTRSPRSWQNWEPMTSTFWMGPMGSRFWKVSKTRSPDVFLGTWKARWFIAILMPSKRGESFSPPTLSQRSLTKPPRLSKREEPRKSFTSEFS